MVAITDPTGRLRSITLLVASDEFGERMIFFRPSLLTTLPGFGENVPSNTVRFQGADPIGTSVANLFGVRIDKVVVLTTESVATAVTALLLVDLPGPLVVADALLESSGTSARIAMVGVSKGDAVITIIPSTRLEPSGTEERYQLDGGDAASFTALHLPFLQLADEPRVRVEVLNGNGPIGTTQPVAALLVSAGFRIVVTDNATALTTR